MGKVFLYRVKDSNDRDCCAYIDNKPMRFECGHYFGSICLHGSCYSGSCRWEDYNNIETILTEEEYNALRKFSADIGSLGYGIKKEDERYRAGVELCNNIQYVYDRLHSDEAIAFYYDIVEQEKQIVMEEYGFDEEYVDEAFANYPLSDDYQDRSIIGAVFDDAEELGYEEAYSLGYVERNSIVERYFDFEAFGQDLLDDEQYYELSCGTIVYYMM